MCLPVHARIYRACFHCHDDGARAHVNGTRLDQCTKALQARKRAAMALDGHVNGHVNAHDLPFHGGDDVRGWVSRDGGPHVNDRSGLRDYGRHESGRGRDERGQKRSCRPS